MWVWGTVLWVILLQVHDLRFSKANLFYQNTLRPVRLCFFFAAQTSSGHHQNLASSHKLLRESMVLLSGPRLLYQEYSERKEAL